MERRQGCNPRGEVRAQGRGVRDPSLEGGFGQGTTPGERVSRLLLLVHDEVGLERPGERWVDLQAPRQRGRQLMEHEAQACRVRTVCRNPLHARRRRGVSPRSLGMPVGEAEREERGRGEVVLEVLAEG